MDCLARYRSILWKASFLLALSAVLLGLPVLPASASGHHCDFNMGMHSHGDTLWQARNRATKGAIAGGVFGSILGVISAGGILVSDAHAHLTHGTGDGTQGSKTTLAAGAGLSMVAFGAIMGRSIGARDVYWEASVRNLPIDTESRLDAALRHLRLAHHLAE